MVKGKQLILSEERNTYRIFGTSLKLVAKLKKVCENRNPVINHYSSQFGVLRNGEMWENRAVDVMKYYLHPSISHKQERPWAGLFRRDRWSTCCLSPLQRHIPIVTQRKLFHKKNMCNSRPSVVGGMHSRSGLSLRAQQMSLG